MNPTLRPSVLPRLAALVAVASVAVVVARADHCPTLRCFDLERGPLVRAPGAPLTEGRGDVRICPDGNTLRFKLRRLDEVQPATVQILVTDTNGLFQLVATEDLRRGRACFKVRERDLDPALNIDYELGVSEVRLLNMNGDDLLEGIVPFAPTLKLLRATKSLENVDKSFARRGRGSTRIEFDGLISRSELIIHVRGMPDGATLELWLENPDTDALEMIDTRVVDKNRRVKFSYKTKDGDRLPFGVPYITDLFERPVEIRTPDQVVRLRGTVPKRKVRRKR